MFVHQPGIEPRSVPWQGTILPLDHWCRHKTVSMNYFPSNFSLRFYGFTLKSETIPLPAQRVEFTSKEEISGRKKVIQKVQRIYTYMNAHKESTCFCYVEIKRFKYKSLWAWFYISDPPEPRCDSRVYQWFRAHQCISATPSAMRNSVAKRSI